MCHGRTCPAVQGEACPPGRVFDLAPTWQPDWFYLEPLNLPSSGPAPAALGFVRLFFGVGQAAGPYVAGATADASKSFWPALWLSAGVALLGAVGSLLLPLKRVGDDG